MTAPRAALPLDHAWTLRQEFRVAVAAVILDEEGRLLLNEHSQRRYYFCGIPAGDLKVAEKPEGGIWQEVREVMGFEVEVLLPLVLYNASEYAHASLIFHCKIISDELRTNLDISSIFFTKGNCQKGSCPPGGNSHACNETAPI